MCVNNLPVGRYMERSERTPTNWLQIRRPIDYATTPHTRPTLKELRIMKSPNTF